MSSSSTSTLPSPAVDRPSPRARAHLRGRAPALGGVARWLRPALPPLAVALAYVAIALLAYWPVSPLSSTHMSPWATADPVQEVWFLAWPVYALRHGLNPFFSSWINYPAGINLASNTSMPLLGFLVSPITLVFGPVASYNFLLRADFAVSAGAAYFVLRRWGASRWAAFAGGLLYGFSPYMLGEGLGHIFLGFVPIPPFVFLVCEELFVRQRRSARLGGLALGVLLGLQWYISAEILAMTVLMVVCGLVLVAAANPAAVRERLRHAALGVAWAVGALVILTGYSVYFFFDGAQHIVGASHPPASLDTYHADLLGSIVPTGIQRFAPSGLGSFGNAMTGNDVTETGSYLGIPLVCFVAVVVARYFSDRRIRLAAGLGLVAFVLSLGSHLRVDDVQTSIPLPFLVIQHLPVLQGMLAGRLTLFEWFFVSVLVALGIDHLLADGLHPLAMAAVGVVCLLPLVPSLPYTREPTGVPAYFSAGGAADRQIPQGSVVLTYPYDFTPDNEAMLWQAVDGMWFKIQGGQAARPRPRTGRATAAATMLNPRQLQLSFLWAMDGPSRLPNWRPPSEALLAIYVRQFCVWHDVPTVVIDPIGLDPAFIVRGVTAALGQPEHTGGLDVWTGVTKRLAAAGHG